MSDRAQKLREQVYVLNKQIRELEDAEEDKLNASLAGKFFRTQNNYSCPKTAKDYWWLYFRVDKTSGGIRGLQFETDSNGHHNIRPDQFMMAASLERYEEITEKAFNHALSKLIGKVEALL